VKLCEFFTGTNAWSVNLKVFMEIIGENQIVRHTEPVWLHRMIGPIVVSTNSFVIIIANAFLGNHALLFPKATDSSYRPMKFG